MVFTWKEYYLFLRREEALRFILCLGNRQFANGNKDKQIRARLTIKLHYIVRAWAVCLFVTRVFGDTSKQDRRTVARFFAKGWKVEKN
jgi:hypothetical protein